MSKLKSVRWLIAAATLVTSFAIAPGANAATATRVVVVTQPSGAVDGAALTVQPVVKIVDGSNATVTSDSKTVVTAAISSGVGTLSGTTSVTAVAGVATFTNLVVTGTLGNFNLTFSSSPALTSATSSSFALALGAASKLAVSAPSIAATYGVPFATQPLVTVQDAGGNKIAANTSSVNVAITGGSGGTLLGTLSKTAVAGVATFSGLSLNGVAGTVYTLTYSDGSLTPATQSVSLAAGAAAKLVLTTAASNAVTGTAFTTTPVVTLLDGGGNTATGNSSTVSVAITAGTGGTLLGTTAKSAVAGVAAFTALGIRGTVGTTYTLTYSDGSLPVVTQNVQVTGRAFKIVITTPADGAVSGQPFSTQPVVSVRDLQGNASILDSGTVSVAITGGGDATLIGTPTVSTVAGVATFSGIGITGMAGIPYTLTFSDGGLVVARQTVTLADAPVTITSGSPSGSASNSGSSDNSNVKGSTSSHHKHHAKKAGASSK